MNGGVRVEHRTKIMKCETTLKMKDAVRVEIVKVDWDLCWGGSRSTKPCVFPCKVASAGDGSYLLCATGAAAVASTAIGPSSVFCNKWLFNVCVLLGVC